MFKTSCRLLLALLMLIWLPARGQDLPTDPRLVRGELPNGLRYIVRRHDNPPGRAAFWLHVSTGSLNEADSQRGLAHFLEHMAFNGSANFPPGSVIPFFQSMGLTFGQHQNAFTSFDQTAYQLALPDTKPETVTKALRFMADVAGRLSLLPAEIENERQVILEERRASLSGQQRVQDALFERLSPGSRFGLRLPIGTEETIKAIGADEFRDYYNRLYVPSNMTVLAVADMPETDVVTAVTEAFAELGGGTKSPVPADADPGIKAPTSNRAIVLTDSELSEASVTVMWLSPPQSPTTTEPLLRADLVRTVGSFAFNRRLGAAVNEGRAAFLSGQAGSADLFRSATIGEVSATGKPESWRAMLDDLGRHLQAARLHGFTAEEAEDARRAILSAAERRADTEPTQPAEAILSQLNSAVADGEPVLSAAQWRDVIARLLPSITAEEASATFAATYNPDLPMIFHLQLPTADGTPSDEDLVTAGVAALAVRPEAQAARARPTSILAALPEPGQVVERQEHDGGKVLGAWLSNGVRVWHRYSDYRKDQVIVQVNLAAGSIEESATDHGISEAAALAWGRPATARCTSTDVRDLLTGKKVGVGGAADDDAMTLGASGSRADIEIGLQLVHALLTEPVVEAPSLAQWKDQGKLAATQRKLDAEGVLFDLIGRSLYPAGDVRNRPLEPAEYDAVTAEAAQARLRRAIAAAPIEVAIVGDIEREPALDLVARYLGSLPKRERISTATLESLRAIQRPDGPITASHPLETATDKAVVLAGFFGADNRNLRDHRRLAMASRILSTRATTEIREAKQLAYSPAVAAIPGIAYPGYGQFLAYSTTAPDKLDDLTRAFADLFDRFATDGPTADEMETVKKQLANSMDEQMREPGFWAQRLGTLTYRGLTVEDVLGGPAAYQALTADDLRETVARYNVPKARFTFTVFPASNK
ncbi:MAG: M16 family metallopeptidase [Phycisphaerales bacterium]